MANNIRYKDIDYKSETELFNKNKHHISINLSVFRFRINDGWDIEKALSTPKGHTKESIEYNGVLYKNLKDLYLKNCHEKSPSIHSFGRKIRKGMSYKEALGEKEGIIYKGVRYKNIKDLYEKNCHKDSFSINTFRNRIKNGMSYEEALGEKNGVIYKGVKYIDLKEIYDKNYNDKTPSIHGFYERIRNGKSIDEALGIDNAQEIENNNKGVNMKNKKRNIEYKGKFYKNARQLYRNSPQEAHISIKEQTFVNRVEFLKWDIDKSFKTPVNNVGSNSKKPRMSTKEILSLKLRNKQVNTESTFEQAFKKSLEDGKKVSDKENNVAPMEKETPIEVKAEDKTSDRKPRSNIFALNKKVNPAEKRVTLYVAKAEIEGTKRAVVGFTTEDKPSDLANLDADILLLSKVGFATAGQIQNKIIEVFFNQHNLEESEVMASSQVFDLREGEYFNALDYIYSLMSSYQNSQQEA